MIGHLALCHGDILERVLHIILQNKDANDFNAVLLKQLICSVRWIKGDLIHNSVKWREVLYNEFVQFLVNNVDIHHLFLRDDIFRYMLS